jgi:pyruvate dehydrogenase E1 component
VVNCNLQRLDGPVRGNGKIIQELEAAFRGAGWNVIKVIWGDDWDPLLAQDKTACWSNGWRKSQTASTRCTRWPAVPISAKTSSARFPELEHMVAKYTDEQLQIAAAAATIPSKCIPPTSGRAAHKGRPR